jgi:hypothetical protein
MIPLVPVNLFHMVILVLVLPQMAVARLVLVVAFLVLPVVVLLDLLVVYLVTLVWLLVRDGNR